MMLLDLFSVYGCSKIVIRILKLKNYVEGEEPDRPQTIQQLTIDNFPKHLLKHTDENHKLDKISSAETVTSNGK